MKRTLVVKEPKAKLIVKESSIEILTFYERQYVGFEQIRAFYLHQDIDVGIKDVLTLSKMFPVYFIDKRGYILAKICRKR
ncbi:hypothetical protein [Hydrogenimonas cancrithermarum]|uniref:Uncharacterized protein n=1 Tax=Hydrogenimonas cancrithermarum TaxID=2993563 RepID=A0ABM8FK03_9BACT|nr:hypothetical protein [Hydrogenimonas cancrithermarum]BDY11968.1 hypothetical protein HCR_02800 [Hydrogenimonas cancrithermarum]